MKMSLADRLADRLLDQVVRSELAVDEPALGSRDRRGSRRPSSDRPQAVEC